MADRTVGMEGVTEVQPQRPVRAENATDLVEHGSDVLDVEFRSRFQAELADPPAAPNAPFGRPELDVRPRVAGLERGGVPDVVRRPFPSRRELGPLVVAHGVAAPEDRGKP